MLDDPMTSPVGVPDVPEIKAMDTADARSVARLYTGTGCHYCARIRSFLRTNAIPFVEVRASSHEFRGQLLSDLDRWSVPVLKTGEGLLLADGMRIIDAFVRSGQSRFAVYPEDPTVLVLAGVLDLFGVQGMLRPALYYRWFFEAVNAPFLRDTLRDYAPSGQSDEASDEEIAQAFASMRRVSADYGVERQSTHAIEESFAQWMMLLDAHLARYPFLLGGHPTIADYGVGSTVLAYLARDPAPLRLVQTHFPKVLRWTSRLNCAEPTVDDALVSESDDLFAPTDLPTSLQHIMRFVARDHLPEIEAQIEWTNQHFGSEYPPLYDPAEKTPYFEQGIGQAVFTWRHIELSSEVLPLHLSFIQRLHDLIDTRGDETTVRMLETLGFGSLIEQRLSPAAQEGLRGLAL